MIEYVEKIIKIDAREVLEGDALYPSRKEVLNVRNYTENCYFNPKRHTILTIDEGNSETSTKILSQEYDIIVYRLFRNFPVHNLEGY